MSKGIELTERKLEGKVVAGIDTHADTHWLCVLDKEAQGSASVHAGRLRGYVAPTELASRTR